MPVALSLIRDAPCYRASAFQEGLKACGYTVRNVWTPYLTDEDILVIWNRYGRWNEYAELAERNGVTVIVAENGYLGRDAAGGPWYALSLSKHNGAGKWPYSGCPAGQRPVRGAPVACKPWRAAGDEIVLLPQRGIGSPGVAMPKMWAERTLQSLRKSYPKVKFRIREHPGERACIPLEQDLDQTSAVVTWGSGAALKALTMGIPVFHEFDKWIGAPACNHLRDFPERYCNDDDRQWMFERLSWAHWKLEEISSGYAFRKLLEAR